jgi:hypothetical protein
VNNKSRNSTEENVKKALTASMKRIDNDQLVRRKIRNKKFFFFFFRNLIY